jgi:hypothetical protein
VLQVLPQTQALHQWHHHRRHGLRPSLLRNAQRLMHQPR